ncbi:putative head-tail adaptor protein [Pseudoalteromonas phage PS_L5]|nr:putative head-tail adaptor protein [Pseudoalteromonas phage PS_L5]
MKCCEITASDLKHKIEIRRLTEVADPLGGFTTSWSLLKPKWAKVKPMSGRELIHADKIDAAAASTFTIRFDADILESDKIVFKGNDYNIRSIVDIDEESRFLSILGEKGVAQ